MGSRRVLVNLLPSPPLLSFKITLFSQLQSSGSSLIEHSVRSISLLSTGIELTPEKSLRLFRVVQPTELSRQTSRAQGDVAKDRMHTVPHLGPAWHGRSYHLGRTLWGPRTCKRQLRFLNLLGEMWHPPTSSPQPIASFLDCPNSSCSHRLKNRVQFVFICLCSHTSSSL